MNEGAGSFRDRGNDSRWLVLQRWGPLVAGSSLALIGVRRRSKTGIALAAAGGLLAYQGTRNQLQMREFRGESSFAVNCSPQEAYRFWRDFENLPSFMQHLESVKVTGDRLLEWTLMLPMGKRISWTSEIIEDRENERISWRTVPGSAVQNRGWVEFRPAPGNRGTIVTAVMLHGPSAGPLGRAASTILGRNLKFNLREYLRRFKALMEAGEIPTIEGQPHGPRSRLVEAIHAVYSKRRKPSRVPPQEPQTAQRRA